MTNPTSTDPHSGKPHDESSETPQCRLAESVECSKAFVRSNPLTSMLGVFAAGVILGCLVSQRHEPTSREKYLDEPLEKLQDLLRTLGEQASQQAAQSSKAATNLVKQLACRFKDALGI